MISRNNYGLDLFNDIFKDPFWNTFYTDGKDRPMKTDIYETPSMYLLEIELPVIPGTTFRQNWRTAI